MTPEQALKAIKQLIDEVDENASPHALLQTIKRVREVVRKILADVPSGRGGR